jgi:hypothetical protein
MVAAPVGAIDLLNGRVQIHGVLSHELHALADGYRIRHSNWFLAQMATSLSAEIEVELAPDGWGPFDLVEGFARLEVRYECVYSHACQLAPSWNYFGDDLRRHPENLANGRTSGFAGFTPNLLQPAARVQPDRRLIDFAQIPPTDRLLSLANPAAFDATFGTLRTAAFTTKHYRGSFTPLSWGMGPLNPEFPIDATGSLAFLPSPTDPLPLRPAAASLYSPSSPLLSRLSELDNFDQNFTENELEWNRGASQQQTKELKEAYLDLTALEGRLVMRVGKQLIVWGKTELFRAQDQFNPQDLALANLPDFEESRIALWAIRGIYSFYDVGPFEDLRIEFAANLDHFEPADVGKCGEPYTVFLVCGLSRGLFEHGWSALGVAGADRPPNWWERARGLEVGLRVEFRLDRFSFAITDFYGYEDFPSADFFHEYERNVDPITGRPRVVARGGPCDPDGLYTSGDTLDCLTPSNALALHPGNRQLFDAVCSSTLGFDVGDSSFAGLIGGALDTSCALTLFTNPADLVPVIPGLTIPFLAATALRGGPTWSLLVGLLCSPAVLNLGPGCLPETTELSVDPVDDYLATIAMGPESALSEALTSPQEALLGCGRAYHGADDGAAFATAAGISLPTGFDGSCNRIGIDLFNAEASVLFQRFPHTGTSRTADLPVATRFLPGVGRIVLPGARSPFDYFVDPEGFRYDPRVDGCIVDLNANLPGVASALNGIQAGLGDACNGVSVDVPLAGGGTRTLSIAEIRNRFPTELSILSENFLKLLVAVGQLTDPDSGCAYGPPDGPGVPETIVRCAFVNGLFDSAGMQRPELRAGGNGRYGRIDFTWSSGSEVILFHERRNVLGASVDFAESLTKTSWSVEFTWFEDQPYANTRAQRGFSREDTLNLTVSVDRPTFVNFLNANRTIFINAQFFVRYIPSYRRLGTFDVDGPFSLLSTLTLQTGYFQDRLLTNLTLIHEAESNSGGQIFEVTYRFTENASVKVGLNQFYGSPRRQRWPRRPAVARMHWADWSQRFNFQGLSAIAERDEIFVEFRYTY